MNEQSVKEKMKAIENEFLKAEGAKSLSGEACRWIGAFLAIFGTLISLGIAYETADRRGLTASLIFLGCGLPLTAIGSVATSNKKIAKAVLIQAQLTKIIHFDSDSNSAV